MARDITDIRDKTIKRVYIQSIEVMRSIICTGKMVMASDVTDIRDKTIKRVNIQSIEMLWWSSLE